MGLRARNRRAAMLHVQTVALERFEANGFAETSVQDIAARAEVSESSVYRYFGGKGGILVWEPLDDLFERALVQYLGTLPILEAAEEAFVSAFSGLDADQKASLMLRNRIARNSPEAAAAVMEQFRSDTAELTEAFAATLRIRANNPRATLLARVVLECIDLALERWESSGGRRALATLVRESFAALRELLIA